MSVDPLNATFSALADPTRRAILDRLARGETSVTELARPFDMSLGDYTSKCSSARVSSRRGARPSGGRAGSRPSP